MANLSTSEEIIADALFRSAEPTDGTSDYADNAVIWLNRVYRGLYMGGNELDETINENWNWLKAEATLVLNPVYDTGTVSVTKNSETAFFSASPTDIDSNDESKQGWFLRVTGKPDIYKLSSHIITATQMTLDSVYTDDTDTTASFKLWKQDYDLQSDLLRLLNPMMEFRHKRPIYGLSEESMERKWPQANISYGSPDRFTQLTETSVRFNKGGSDNDELIKINYDYLQRPADLANDTGTPALPQQYRYVLSDFLRAIILEDKEDTRTGDAYLQARAGLKAMARENKARMAKYGSPGAIFPRQGQVHAGAHGPLRTETGLIIG
jgi:hypothetical protein